MSSVAIRGKRKRLFCGWRRGGGAFRVCADNVLYSDGWWWLGACAGVWGGGGSNMCSFIGDRVRVVCILSYYKIGCFMRRLRGIGKTVLLCVVWSKTYVR